eukprot:scaffold130371_cov40-Cyclotella_meneghiniana.AAC.1
MTSILDEWMGKGFNPLVMIDSNSDINESKLKEFTDQNGLSDMITVGRDSSVAPPTYTRGKQRIDFILGDEHIKRAIVHWGFLELHDGLKASDHTMQYLDLDEKLLFRDDSFTPMPGYHREFKLYDTKRKTKFQEYLQEAYERQRIAERVEEIALKMEGKLREPILAEHGTSSITDEILNGTFDFENLDISKEMKLFLQSLQQTPTEREMQIPGRMPREAFQEVMKIQNENTLSSPSALHYTLWKAIAEVNDLAEINSLWLSLQFMYGFICNRHKREIDCMLEKKPGVRQIHILRIIGLMEACWNAYLKWAYNKHVMPNAEKAGLSSNQWGGRRGRGAIACAMRKLMTWEYFRFVKETVLSFPGDLQSNFDRMIPSFNSIISMKYGMSRNAARCRAATVEAFERSIRTAAGTSERIYRHEEGDVKLGGEIQGKPDNMQLWAMESSLLLNMHEKHCHGVELTAFQLWLLCRSQLPL